MLHNNDDRDMSKKMSGVTEQEQCYMQVTTAGVKRVETIRTKMKKKLERNAWLVGKIVKQRRGNKGWTQVREMDGRLPKGSKTTKKGC